jgi:hypothetical protein
VEVVVAHQVLVMEVEVEGAVPQCLGRQVLEGQQIQLVLLHLLIVVLVVEVVEEVITYQMVRMVVRVVVAGY